METAFRLPVNPEQTISVLYQKPASLPVLPVETAPINAKKPPKAPKTPAEPPLAVMMHNFPGAHKAGTDDLFGELTHRLARMGYPTLRFDFRGSGESDCTLAEFTLDTALEDLKAVLDWARKQGHRQFMLMGEGVGAVIAVLGYNPRDVAGLMLFWPAVVLRDTWFSELFTHEARMANDKRDAPFVPFRQWRLGVPFYNDIYKTDLRGPLEQVKVPVFIQHGTADEIVPLEQTYFARDHLGGPVELAIFEGGGHGLRAANMREVMFTNVDYFLAKILKKLDRPLKS